MQVECQLAARNAQAFAVLRNAVNAILSNFRSSLPNSEGFRAEFSLTDGLTASRCWVNVLVSVDSR